MWHKLDLPRSWVLPLLDMQFPEFVYRLHKQFTEAGHELYAVGGCVRDSLLGKEVQELDFATSAHPEEIKRLLAPLRPDSVYTVGERFGTIGAIFGPYRVEITTYRGEWYSPDSRKPEVTFGISLEEDLSRRDFTVNAIAMDIPSGRLIDPFGGVEDLHSKVIRAVGDPDARFRDDPLRLMRAVRFAANLGFKIEPRTAEAIRRHAAQICKISIERVRDELTRMLTGPAPDVAIAALVDLGLMQYIVPEVVELKQVSTGGGKHKDIFIHTLKVVRNTPPDLVIRWAALLHDIAKPRTFGIRDGKVHFDHHETIGAKMAEEILSRLHYDRQTIEAVAKVVRMHTQANSYDPEVWTDGAVRRLVREAGDELEPLLALSQADITSYRRQKVEAGVQRVRELRERIQRLEEEAAIRELRPPLDGNDLMRIFGRGPGPWIKPLKNYLLDLVIDGQLAPDDRQTAERLVREKYQELYGSETLTSTSETRQT
ncbi:polynucleotide adenylyltransferase/metal dependent phosphohydrolase [Thermobaculum terrenum ATCC BAA-798]|uniref:Polynucleotide adenylyltransferase/metal dependent phosphohydrolase n=1 Tax=Thermobaculum terrenum (strain ATCC BAA-798 / CCMEE 7001 / YNP1) TaxID=525904 RepID=D1CJ19_THET1|nr:CCA tRNA nucleotidyltransferase [Thermobaculum terrenum]ACZ43739.1 polynucleotide adenylyltransferase/metal dependent phosphohydrolase [Thermobaculum terrenum ATCC BAA-798]